MTTVKNNLIVRIAMLAGEVEKTLATYNVLQGQKAEAEFILKTFLEDSEKVLEAVAPAADNGAVEDHNVTETTTPGVPPTPESPPTEEQANG